MMLNRSPFFFFFKLSETPSNNDIKIQSIKIQCVCFGFILCWMECYMLAPANCHTNIIKYLIEEKATPGLQQSYVVYQIIILGALIINLRLAEASAILVSCD